MYSRSNTIYEGFDQLRDFYCLVCTKTLGEKTKSLRIVKDLIRSNMAEGGGGVVVLVVECELYCHNFETTSTRCFWIT